MSDQNPAPMSDDDWANHMNTARQHTIDTYNAVRQEMMQEIDNQMQARAAQSAQGIIDKLMRGS